jgi:uncharacterized coiled-coil protein SlyX
MATLDERVAYLEGQMAEQSHTFLAIRDTLKDIDQRIDRVDQRIDRVEQRIDRLEQRMDARFDAIDRRFEAIGHRFAGIDDKMSRQFLWIVGIQITTLVAVVGAVLSRG